MQFVSSNVENCRLKENVYNVLSNKPKKRLLFEVTGLFLPEKAALDRQSKSDSDSDSDCFLLSGLSNLEHNPRKRLTALHTYN